MKNDFYAHLNPEQRDAVEHTDGPLLVFAGAGSGKTGVITYRVANLVINHGVDPEDILAVTFTKKASEEMVERISHIFDELGVGTEKMPMIGTFHSICARILRDNHRDAGLGSNFTIYDMSDSEGLVKEIMMARELDTKQFKPKTILSMIGSAKNDMVSPDQYEYHYSGFVEDIVADVYRDYQEQLTQLNGVDFADLLFRTVQLFNDNEGILDVYQDKYQYLLVDEYQDTNKVQYHFVKNLADKHSNLCVVGDDDQSIYKWRGADITNIISFEKDFDTVKTVKLEQNYRSVGNVIQAAVAVIGQNSNRVAKELWTAKGSGDPITVYQARDEKGEALFILDEIAQLQRQGMQLGDIAVLYRTNFQSRIIEEGFLQRGVPYKLVGGYRFYDRREVKDLLSYLKVIDNRKDDLSLYRIINVPSRKMGPKSVANLAKIAREMEVSTMELLVLSYAHRRPDIDPEEFGFTKEQVEATEAIINDLGKYSRVIDIFGSLYFESVGKDALEVLELVVDRIKYVDYVDDGSEAGVYKRENVAELKNVAASFAQRSKESSLNDFLANIALLESKKDNQDLNEGSVTLMTMHSSKGLEFPAVFIVGMEEGILPHSRTFTDPAEVEEERRLCYVGITRAKAKLHLSFAQTRAVGGSLQEQIPSRFLAEIPEDICEYFSWEY